MYILTIKKDKQVTSELFVDHSLAKKDFLAELDQYEHTKGLELTKREREQMAEEGIFEHENFAIFLTEPDTTYQLAQEMDDQEICDFISEQDIDLSGLNDRKVEQFLESCDGDGLYILRFDNLLEEMRAKEIVENFGK